MYLRKFVEDGSKCARQLEDICCCVQKIELISRKFSLQQKESDEFVGNFHENQNAWTIFEKTKPRIFL